jgi:hypothetical protein
MASDNFGPTVFGEVLGVLSIVGTVVTSPLLRPWYRKWGATTEELKMVLPGDALVPNPRLESTRAVTIQASAARVWPWLVQMGQGRGGLYSYERLENLVGCDMQNVDAIIPQYQELNVGDQVGLGPEGYPAFEVAAIVPGIALILRGDTPNPNGKPTTWIWIFYLAPIDEHTTRLLLRSRLDYEPTLGNNISWRVFTDPIAFNMEREMLRGIRRRAEASASA